METSEVDTTVDTATQPIVSGFTAIEPELESRTIKTDEGEFAFTFLVLDSPTKWPVASELKSRFEMAVPGSQQRLAFSLQAISLADYEQVEIENEIPEPPSDMDIDPHAKQKYERDKERAISKKQVALFEKAFGKTIPGANIDEKITFLEERSPGDLDAVHRFIQSVCCNFVDGSLLDTYNSVMMNSKKAEILEVSDFSDWTVAKDSHSLFRLQRSAETYITEIPLRGISKEQKAAIEDRAREPDPPKRPKRNPVTKRFDASLGLEPATDDPSWRKLARATNQVKTVLLFEAALPFPLPGTTHQEKYNWLAQRCVGDVIRLKEFITEELIGYRSRYDFFTAF